MKLPIPCSTELDPDERNVIIMEKGVDSQNNKNEL